MKDDAQPPAHAYSGLDAALASTAGDATAAALLRAHLDSEPAPYDTHPTVRQRIEHLGFDVDELARETAANGRASAPSAARVYLGAAEPKVLATLDADWQRAVSPSWREQHGAAQAAKGRLEEFERRQAESLSRDEQMEHAHLVTTFRSEAEGVAMLRGLVEEEDDAYARFILGQTLLSQGDERGLAELDRAMELDPQAVPEAARTAWNYLVERGRAEEAEPYRLRAMGVISELEAAQAERARIDANGPFASPTLSAEAVGRLREALASLPKLKRAYLVRKPMEHLDHDYPLHVLFLEPRGLIHNRPKLVDGAVAAFDFDGWVLCPSDTKLKSLRLGRLEGAKIFER